jgi:hypothetical protein
MSDKSLGKYGLKFLRLKWLLGSGIEGRFRKRREVSLDVVKMCRQKAGVSLRKS